MTTYNLNKNKETKRLIAEIPLTLHKEVSIQGILRGISIKEYVLQAILEKIARDESFIK